MELTGTDQLADGSPHVNIEMGGDNLIIRPAATVDRAYTDALAHTIDAATATGTVVVIDPEPVRCDETFTSRERLPSETECSGHDRCRPVDVEVAAPGVLRVAGEFTNWIVDVGRSRFCRTDTRRDISFLPAHVWTTVSAICVTPTEISALTPEGTVVSGRRAHHQPAR